MSTKRKSIMIEDGGYLDSLGHGAISGYVGMATRAHRDMLILMCMESLSLTYKDEEMAKVIEQFDPRKGHDGEELTCETITAAATMWLVACKAGLAPHELIALLRRDCNV